MAKVCEPFYGKKCQQFEGGRCRNNVYHLEYKNVLGETRFNPQREINLTITNLGVYGNFGSILGEIDCITELFIPRIDDPFVIKYGVYDPFRVFPSVFIFLRGSLIPIQIRFFAVFGQPVIAATLIRVFNFTTQGIDECGNFDPTTLDECDCEPTDQKIGCGTGKNDFCCIDNSKLKSLCNRL